MTLLDDFHAAVTIAAKREHMRRAEAVEAACVRALYFGCGVRVYNSEENFEVFADPEVPKGQILWQDSPTRLTKPSETSGSPMVNASESRSPVQAP